MGDFSGVSERESAAPDNSFLLEEQQCSPDHKVHSKAFLSFVFIL